MAPVKVIIETPVEKPMKEPERSKLVGGLIDAFRKSKVEPAEISEWYYVDRRSPISPVEGITSIAISVKTGATSVELAQFLDNLIASGKRTKRNVVARIGSTLLVDGGGNAISDEDIIRLMYEARKKEAAAAKLGKVAVRKALAFGTTVYAPWGSAPIQIIITLFSQDAIRRAASGRAGLNPVVRVKWFSCTICNGDYEFCDHEVGQKYEEREDAKPCAVIPRDIQFVEDSIVDLSVEPNNRITDLLIIEDYDRFEWYGFKSTSILERLGNIRSVRKDGLISDAAANKFRYYFSNRSVGRCKFHKVEVEKRVKKKKSTGASRRKIR
ncbi:MAG: hypothetical protein ACREBS_08985 [Nitrososphaerales archaeon]